MVFHILTCILFLLKVLDYINISWWLVVAPSLVVFGFLFITLGVAGIGALLVGAFSHKNRR